MYVLDIETVSVTTILVRRSLSSAGRTGDDSDGRNEQWLDLTQVAAAAT